MIRTILLALLTLVLGSFFILVGQFKVTPKFYPDAYEDMEEEFGRFNKVFPLYPLIGWRPSAENYRLAVGLTELICGLILIVIPGRLRLMANTALLVIMIGAVYTHYALHDEFGRIVPGLVFGSLLTLRLFLSQQPSGKDSVKNVDSRRKKVE